MIRHEEVLDSEVDLESLAPRDVREDVFSDERFGEVSEVVTLVVGVWDFAEGEGCCRGACGHRRRARAGTSRAGERLVICPRQTQALPQLVEGSMGDEGQTHLPWAAAEVQGAGTFPGQILRSTKELLDVPALRIIVGEGLDFILIGSGVEGFEVIGAGGSPAALDELDQGAIGKLVVVKILFADGPTDSRRGEGCGRERGCRRPVRAARSVA